MNSAFRLSLAIPLHNEETVLPELLRRTRAVLDQIAGGPHEIVFVDDGSTDRTFALLEEAARQDSRIRAISLSRNFGHQAALTAALDHVSGDAAVVMDGDLQDVPEAVPHFVERFQQGYDVVYAQRIRRKEPWPLRLCYFVFYRLMARLSDVRLPLDSGDFGLMSRRVIDRVRRMPEHHRYLRGMRSWVGFRQTGLPVEREERHSGKSKYGFLRLLKLATDGIFAFSIVPIRAAALLGAAAIGLSMLYVLYALYYRFFLQQSPQGFTALIAAVTFLAGVLLFFLGVIGEYVGRIYEETKARPLYIIERIAGTLEKGGAGENPSEARRSERFPERELFR
jgi:dolichol-phosphate mannosyltransferase